MNDNSSSSKAKGCEHLYQPVDSTGQQACIWCNDRKPQHRGEPPLASGASKATVADWFESSLMFRRLCMVAQDQASTEKDREFTASMLQKAERFGLRTYVSSGQVAWLCRLAQQDIPERRPKT